MTLSKISLLAALLVGTQAFPQDFCSKSPDEQLDLYYKHFSTVETINDCLCRLPLTTQFNDRESAHYSVTLSQSSECDNHDAIQAFLKNWKDSHQIVNNKIEDLNEGIKDLQNTVDVAHQNGAVDKSQIQLLQYSILIQEKTNPRDGHIEALALRYFEMISHLRKDHCIALHPKIEEDIQMIASDQKFRKPSKEMIHRCARRLNAQGIEYQHHDDHSNSDEEEEEVDSAGRDASKPSGMHTVDISSKAPLIIGIIGGCVAVGAGVSYFFYRKRKQQSHQPLVI